MKTLFSTLLLAFAVVMVSCGSKTAKAEEAAAPEEIVVVDEKACTCEDGKECTCEKCSKASEKEEVAVDEAAKKAE